MYLRMYLKIIHFKGELWVAILILIKTNKSIDFETSDSKISKNFYIAICCTKEKYEIEELWYN